jgi:branched-chain amino acid transport system substrate-binding protein
MKRPKSLIAAALLAGTLLTACSSSSGTTGQSAGGKGETIKVGFICSCSGPDAPAIALAKDAADTWAKSVNAAGGINGHKVQIFIKDDGMNPATSLQQVKELVQQDKVVAIVGEVSVVDSTWADYVKAKGVPVVGGLSIEAPFLSNPDFFPSGTSTAQLSVGMMQLMKKHGKTHFGQLYCAEAPVCAGLADLAEATAKIVGGTQVTAGKVSVTAPKYDAECLALKSAGVDAVNIASTAVTVQRVQANCVQLGYKPLPVAQSGTIATSWLKDPNMEGALIAMSNANYLDASIPAVKEFLDAMDTYHPGDRDSAQFAYDVIYPWIGGKLFEAAAKAANLGPSSTAADVKKGLWSLKNETLGGLSSPLAFSQGTTTFPNCYFVAKVQDGKFASPEGTGPTCMTDAETAALKQAVGVKG